MPDVTPQLAGNGAPASPNIPADIWQRLKLPHTTALPRPKANANTIAEDTMSPLDKFAVKITDKVGSMTFFLIIFGWTILWTGYNILASEAPGLHWKSFDPFPAFVAYLLISNVIQILLMPLIMVGQNLQGKHSEIRAQLDFETNQLAEKEVTVILQHLEHQTDLLIKLMRHLECRISEEEMRAIEAEHKLAETVAKVQPGKIPAQATT